jgi:hypothetical protein
MFNKNLITISFVPVGPTMFGPPGGGRRMIGRDSDPWDPSKPTPSGGVSPFLLVDAENGTHFTDAGSTPAGNNNAVYTITDDSGNNYDLIQTTEAYRPLLITNSLNGNAVFRFDGANDSSAVTYGMTYSQPCTVVFVFRLFPDDVNDNIQHNIFDTIHTDYRQSFYSYAGNTPDAFTIYAGSNSAYITPNSGTDTTWHVLVLTFNDTAPVLRLDGVSKTLSNLNIGPDGQTGFTLGARFDGWYGAHVDIAFVAIYNSALSSGDAATIETYFKQRFFKTTAPTVNSAVIAADGTTITITFGEEITGDGSSYFNVDGGENGDNLLLTDQSGSGTTRTYTIADTIYSGETVTLDYTGSTITDLFRNNLATFSGASVTNNSTQSSAPTVDSAVIAADGTTITITFSEAVTGDGSSYFNVDGGSSGNNLLLTGQSGSGTTRTYTIADTIYSGETITLDYTGSTITDLFSNALATFSGASVTNNSEQTTGATGTFGSTYTTASGLSDGGFIIGRQVTATYNGDVVALDVYLTDSDASASVALAIYSDSGNAPNAMLGTTAKTADPNVAGWNRIALSSSVAVTASTNYWVMLWIDTDGDASQRVSKSADGTAYNSSWYSAGAVNVASWPSGGLMNTENRDMGVRASYDS